MLTIAVVLYIGRVHLQKSGCGKLEIFCVGRHLMPQAGLDVNLRGGAMILPQHGTNTCCRSITFV